MFPESPNPALILKLPVALRVLKTGRALGWIKFLETVAAHDAWSGWVETLAKIPLNRFPFRSRVPQTV